MGFAFKCFIERVVKICMNYVLRIVVFESSLDNAFFFHFDGVEDTIEAETSEI